MKHEDCFEGRCVNYGQSNPNITVCKCPVSRGDPDCFYHRTSVQNGIGQSGSAVASIVVVTLLLLLNAFMITMMCCFSDSDACVGVGMMLIFTGSGLIGCLIWMGFSVSGIYECAFRDAA